MSEDQTFEHIPVLLTEVLELLNPQPGETVVDGTVGGGGHAAEIAKLIGAKGTLIGMDLDPAALKQTELNFEKQKIKTKLKLIHDNYSNISDSLRDQGIPNVDAILVDIGISSYDLDNSKRGFSFQKDEPLDMRYNPESRPADKNKEPRTAKFILSHYQEHELLKIFKEYGEEKFSNRIARAIVKTRQEREINTTTELFDLIKHALPGAVRFKAADSARRIWQSLRIEVNRELDNLEKFLPAAFAALRPGGRLAVISFHSLEDRMVKQYFLSLAKGCICPPDFPQCVCGKEALVKILTKKPVIATAQEQAENSRSKPAKLRVILKI